MPASVLEPHPQHKRIVRSIRVDLSATRALVESLGEVTSMEQVGFRLRAFYRTHGEALELRRKSMLVTANEWAATQRRLDLLGCASLLPGAPLPITGREWRLARSLIERLAWSLAHSEELASIYRSDLERVIELVKLRVSDPRQAACQTIAEVLEASDEDDLDIVEAALEICTGPDPVLLDIELSLDTPPIFSFGFALVTDADAWLSVKEVSLLIDNDLLDFADECLDVAARLDPESNLYIPPGFAEITEQLGRSALSIHDRGDGGLMLARLHNHALG